MARGNVIDFAAALAAADEAVALAEAAEIRARTPQGRREAREAQTKAMLADFGLSAPLTERQAEALLRVLDNTFSTLPIGYVASPLDGPPLSVLARAGLASYERERIGDLGPAARSLTVWRLTRRGTKVAIALKRGELPTAEAHAANDRRAS